ncbi:solute carrier family 15 member 1-like [Rhinoraja longicauda]
MPEYETMESLSQGTDNVKPASNPDLPKVSGRAWGRLLKLFHLNPAVIFILITEFFEKIAFFGQRAILVLFFTDALFLSESKATSLYHVFTFFATAFTILGAFLSDFFCGLYRSILIFSILFLVGATLLSATAYPLPIESSGVGSFIGLFLISLGFGSIQSNLSHFGADQIGMKEEKQYWTYFSLFYFSVNLAFLISGICVPLLRADVQCLNADCYPLAFGVCALAVLVALVFFGVGTSRYKIHPPSGNLFCKVFSATVSALKNKIKWLRNKKKEKAREHWLDWADPQYERDLIIDAKQLYNLLVLYPLMPMYWALYEQQGSRWTLQAQEMELSMGSLRLKPEQLQTLNLFFVLFLLPLFEGVIYPQFEKINLLLRPVTRMSIGLFGAVLAFFIAGIVQLQIQKWQIPPQPDGVTELKFFNGALCNLSIDFLENHLVMDRHALSPSYPVPTVPSTLRITPVHCSLPPVPESINFTTDSETRSTVFIVQDLTTRELTVTQIPDNTVKILENSVLVRVFPLLEASPSRNRTVRLKCKPDASEDVDVKPFVPSAYTPIQFGRCSLELSEGVGLNVTPIEGEVELKDGGVYTIVLHQANNTENVTMELNIDRWPKTISVLWQIPQYLVISITEILFVVPGLHLAYTQAPSSMRSVTMAAWFATKGIGNLIVVIFAESALISNQAVEFFVFAALMGLASLIFCLTARFYKYHPIDKSNTEENETDGLNSDMKSPLPYSNKETRQQEFWSLHYGKDVLVLEKVQRRFTGHLSGKNHARCDALGNHLPLPKLKQVQVSPV